MKNFILGIWHPLIDDDKCNNCGICLDFCPRGVYEKEDKVIVANPEKCVDNCHGCKWRCPYGAITFPETFSREYALKVIDYYLEKDKELPERLIKFLKEKNIMNEAEINFK